jgi:hypothetical protein
MRALPLLPLLSILAGCAAAGTDVETRDRRALDDELAAMTAGEARSCVPARQAENLIAVDARTIVLRSGATTWVSRLETDCPGLRPLDTIIVEAHGSQYCAGDRIRSLPPHGTIPGPICVLRDFVPYRRRG